MPSSPSGIEHPRDRNSVAANAMRTAEAHDEFFKRMKEEGFPCISPFDQQPSFSNLHRRLFGKEGYFIGSALGIKGIPPTQESIHVQLRTLLKEVSTDPQLARFGIVFAAAEEELHMREAVETELLSQPEFQGKNIGDEEVAKSYVARDPRTKELLFRCAKLLMQKGVAFDDLW